MTIRASWGMFYDTPHSLFYYNYSAEPPWGTTITLTNPPGGLTNPWQGIPGGNPFPIQLGNKNLTFPNNGYYETVPLNEHATYLEQWNLSIQKQLGSNWLLSANYLGNNTIHLWTDREFDPAVYMPGASCVINGVSYSPCSSTSNTAARRVLTLQNPSQGALFSQLELLDDGGTGSYNALLLSVQHRLANHFTLLANYTWSHCISDWVTTELSYPDYTNPNNRRADRGNCVGTEIRQLFNLSAVLQSPHFTQRWMQVIAGNWQVSPIVALHSGSYFFATEGIDVALTGIANQRPNQVLPNPYCQPKTINCWLNPAAFADAATGTLGNLGINNLVGPGYYDVDVALSRRIAIRERRYAEFRAEAFNLENRANFINPLGPPGTQGFGTATAALNSSSFGRIFQDVSPRIMQFAIKVVF